MLCQWIAAPDAGTAVDKPGEMVGVASDSVTPLAGLLSLL